MAESMTAGDLKAALADVPDDMIVMFNHFGATYFVNLIEVQEQGLLDPPTPKGGLHLDRPDHWEIYLKQRECTGNVVMLYP